MSMYKNIEYFQKQVSPDELNKFLKYLSVLEDVVSFSWEGRGNLDHAKFGDDISVEDVSKLTWWMMEHTTIFLDVKSNKNNSSKNHSGMMIDFSDDAMGEIRALKKEVTFAMNNDATEKDVTACKSTCFHFIKGVLFRDHDDGLLCINENTIEYNLLRVAFELKIYERLDSMTEGLGDYNSEQLYKTALRVNNKILNEFKIDSFFDIDYANKHVKRSIQ
jgi:hypothetical protein